MRRPLPWWLPKRAAACWTGCSEAREHLCSRSGGAKLRGRRVTTATLTLSEPSPVAAAVTESSIHCFAGLGPKLFKQISSQPRLSKTRPILHLWSLYITLQDQALPHNHWSLKWPENHREYPAEERKKKEVVVRSSTSEPLSGQLWWPRMCRHVQKTPLTTGYKPQSILTGVCLAICQKRTRKFRRSTLSQDLSGDLTADHPRLWPLDHRGQ